MWGAFTVPVLSSPIAGGGAIRRVGSNRPAGLLGLLAHYLLVATQPAPEVRADVAVDYAHGNRLTVGPPYQPRSTIR